MSLADRIIDERKKAHWSQEKLAYRLNVSRQAVSKWESEAAVPDLNRVVQMADLFGVTTDYLLKGDVAEGAGVPSQATIKPARFVSEEEAHAFLAYKQKSIPLVALGVALCVLSPVLLVVLDGLAHDEVFGLTNEVAIAIGLPALFIFVGIAVYLFVSQGAKGEAYEYLKEERVLVAEPVQKEVANLKLSQTESFGRNMAVGIAMCVVACVPLIIASCFTSEASVICAFVGVLLVILAIGVYVMARTAATREAYDMLLQVNDYREEEKSLRKTLNWFSGVYWLVATAIYLAGSLITGKWGASWILWAVAGVLFPVGYSIVKYFAEKRAH